MEKGPKQPKQLIGAGLAGATLALGGFIGLQEIRDGDKTEPTALFQPEQEQAQPEQEQEKPETQTPPPLPPEFNDIDVGITWRVGGEYFTPALVSPRTVKDSYTDESRLLENCWTSRGDTLRLGEKGIVVTRKSKKNEPEYCKPTETVDIRLPELNRQNAIFVRFTNLTRNTRNFRAKVRKIEQANALPLRFPKGPIGSKRILNDSPTVFLRYDSPGGNSRSPVSSYFGDICDSAGSYEKIGEIGEGTLAAFSDPNAWPNANKAFYVATGPSAILRVINPNDRSDECPTGTIITHPLDEVVLG